MVSEEQTTKENHAKGSGVHTYYANDENHDEFSPNFRLASDGHITVTGK